MSERAFERFTVWQLILGCLHYAAAFSIAGYSESQGKDWKTHVFYRYNAWVGNVNETLPSGDGSMIYVVTEKVSNTELSLIWAAASFSLISGTHHFVAYWFSDWYRRTCIDTGVNGIRWLDYAASSGLMFTIISILFTAPPDLNSLMLSYSTQSLVIAAGAGSEAVYAAGKRAWSKLVYLSTLALFAVPWIGLFVTFGIANDTNTRPTEDQCGVSVPPGT